MVIVLPYSREVDSETEDTVEHDSAFCDVRAEAEETVEFRT
jgi:hypothetical protein